MSGTIVNPQEYAILRAMDQEFVKELNSELKDYQTRREEKQKLELEAAKAKRGKRR